MFRMPFMDPNGRQAVCGVEISNRIVVITELPENRGMSVTNCCEFLAAYVANSFNVDPNKVVWVEHYPERDGLDETFDLVELRWRHTAHGWTVIGRPRWAPSSAKFVRAYLEAE